VNGLRGEGLAAQRSITSFRPWLTATLRREANGSDARHIVVLAVDGIPYDVACDAWPHARIECMTSVFPTTSSSAWLSALTGLGVSTHGVPGVAFAGSATSDELINVFEYRGRGLDFDGGNIFSDAVAAGYVPVSILGDLEPFDCSWRELLLSHSTYMGGWRFYTQESNDVPVDASRLAADVVAAVTSAIERYGRSAPCLVWCFIDVDRYVHRFGYDDGVMRVLQAIDRLALRLVDERRIVVGHSDHGLIETRHNELVAARLHEACGQYGWRVGGAGRVRWIHADRADCTTVTEWCHRQMPSDVRICHSDGYFERGSRGRSRVGDVLLIATGDEFITSSAYVLDHGSWTQREIHVPCAIWQA
jgi:hypothetical protein